MTNTNKIQAIPAVAELSNTANYFHVRTVESSQTLREFTAATISYLPCWLRFLYCVRECFALLLGAQQEDMPQKASIAPEDLSFTPGEMASFFTVVAGEEDSFWLGEARDDMIAGGFGFVCEPGSNGMNRYHVISTATYLRGVARIYFNVIRPFHHLVVHCMITDALKQSRK